MCKNVLHSHECSNKPTFIPNWWTDFLLCKPIYTPLLENAVISFIFLFLSQLFCVNIRVCVSTFIGVQFNLSDIFPVCVFTECSFLLFLFSITNFHVSCGRKPLYIWKLTRRWCGIFLHFFPLPIQTIAAKQQRKKIIKNSWWKMWKLLVASG